MRIPSDLYQKRYRDRRGRQGRRSRFSWRQSWRAWIDKRLPPKREQVLSHRNIFIFPSRAGLVFTGLLVMLLLVAINFENSAIFALVFLLGGLLVVSILHTFGNLMGLKISGRTAEAAFAGRQAIFPIMLSATGRQHFGVQLSWQDISSDRIDVAKQSERSIPMRFRTGPRGICKPGRIKVETSYPLGLITAWTWVDLAIDTVVYPFPDKSAGEPVSQSAYHESGVQERAGSDDFFGLRSYVVGDSMRSVAWKTFAKTGQLSSKQFVDYIDHRLWLDWNNVTGDDEQRLQQLCHWALVAESGHHEYGLRLPGVNVPPGRGMPHLNILLSELALYKLPLKHSSGSYAGSMRQAGSSKPSVAL